MILIIITKRKNDGGTNSMIIIQYDNNNDKDVIYKNATARDELRMPPCDGDLLTNIRALTNR